MLVALVLLVGPRDGAAQAEAPTEGETTVEWIRPEEVSARADALRHRVDAARIDAAAVADLNRIEQAVAGLAPDLDRAIGRSMGVSRAGSPPQLEDIRRELSGLATPLDAWKDELAAEAQRVAQTLDALARAEQVWLESRARPETTAAGDVVRRRVETSLATVREAVAHQEAWRARVLAASDRVLSERTAREAALERVKAAIEAPRVRLLVPDREPLWTRSFGAAIRRELPRAPAVMLAYGRRTFEYVARDPRPVVLQVVLAMLLMIAFRGLLGRARRGLAGEELPTRAVRLFERPYSVSVLLAVLASPLLHPLAPLRFTQLLGMIAFVPAARVVARASESIGAVVFAGLFALLLLDRLALALAPLPALARTTFLVLLLLALALAAWLARRLDAARDPRWLRRAAWVASGGLALGVLAEVGGWTYLATLLGRGVGGAAVGALYVCAAVVVLDAAVAYVLRLQPVRRSRLVARKTAVLQRHVGRALRAVGIVLWLYLLLGALGLRGQATDVLAALTAAGVSVGALTISIADVVAFLLTILVALLLVRVVLGVLEEDVFPRANLPRGVPYALSALVRYGVYTLGVVLAFAAAGVELSQLSILIGGLGIGIGLGLQDIVKNFAAGLTLLVERRIHVGDAVHMPGQEVFGHVRAIGMRATVVRNWDGSEVIVPNADLVARAVTNWTLSDRLCRIEVPVGVAYGTDPERVLALLLDAVRSVDELVAEPAPQALFKGFGESSLDFVVRAWTDGGYERRLPLTSALTLAVHRQLREASVTIPFPQRDLHVATVAPGVGAALADPGRKK